MFFIQESLSKAKRDKNYVEKLKQTNKYDEYKKKKADLMKKNRAKKKEEENLLPISKTSKIIAQRRENARKRAQTFRQRQKEQKLSSNDSNNAVGKSYRSVQSLGKAVRKATRALPDSPKKKQTVVAKMVAQWDPNAQNALVNLIVTPTKRAHGIVENAELIESIHAFYTRDDISRMSPKVKDVKTYTCPETGKLVKLPTRHMLYSQKEAFALFDDERTENGKGSHTQRVDVFVTNTSLCSKYLFIFILHSQQLVD